MITLTESLPAVDPVAAPEGAVVGMGDLGVAPGDRTVTTVGLGSCLASSIFSPAQQLAVLAHCMLPARDQGDGPLSTDADTAVPALMTLLREHGAASPLAAARVCGASMFPGIASVGKPVIAAQNIAVALQTRAAAGIPVRTEDVGGRLCRSVIVEPARPRIVMHSIRGRQRCL